MEPIKSHTIVAGFVICSSSSFTGKKCGSKRTWTQTTRIGTHVHYCTGILRFLFFCCIVPFVRCYIIAGPGWHFTNDILCVLETRSSKGFRVPDRHFPACRSASSHTYTLKMGWLYAHAEALNTQTTTNQHYCRLS